MSIHATPDASTPFLVRSTESGAYFQKPLANVLRFIAVIGFLPPIVLLGKSADVPEDLAGPMAMFGLATLVAAGLSAQVLFHRALRVVTGGAGVRFPVTPALRECTRGLAEANYLWSMVYSLFGLLAFFWYAGIDDLETDAKAVAIALGAAFVGWMILLLVHLATELATALVEIANNTHGGVRAAGGAPDVAPPSAPVPEAAPSEPPAPPPKGRALALVGAGVVLVGGALAFTSGAEESGGTSKGASSGQADAVKGAAPGAAAAAEQLRAIADQIRVAEAQYDAQHDGFLPVAVGELREASAAGGGTNPSGLPLHYVSGDMDRCGVIDLLDDFLIICTVDKDADGCSLSVSATKDKPAYVNSGTENCV